MLLSSYGREIVVWDITELMFKKKKLLKRNMLVIFNENMIKWEIAIYSRDTYFTLPSRLGL